MMSLEIIVFIASILFGIVLYWRESKSNKVYRFFNKIFYSKELQMSDSSAKGFLYQQSFLMRLVYIGVLFLVGIVVVRFIIPIDLATLSLFASSIFGTLLGTYLANFVFKSSEVIDEKSDSLLDAVKDTVEKGKDFIQDLESKDAKVETEVKQEMNSKPEAEKQSARDRLKDKGLM
ncbi:hypothetical protein DFQ10_102271 [Winogradskyella eximia]|jgi:hypothetical protein|uniref:Uncharacterized protein n=1 Tax=Winogradskyella eximia TaxID=262006 RepID=A0A3D9H7D2_9FLAO|nr:hypothetical protein [Winogradskyella eximia]RED45403.1 hypothetical protein DFQ10_102271 [Winogradskyella eximia]